MGKAPHEVTDRGRETLMKMKNLFSITSEAILMMTMIEGDTEEMIVTATLPMIMIGAVAMTSAMTTT